MHDSAAANSLSYARGTVVGAITLDRSPTKLAIHANRSTPAMRLGLALLALGVVAGTAAVALQWLPSRPSQLIATLWIPLACIGLGWVVSSLSIVLSAFHPRIIEVS